MTHDNMMANASSPSRLPTVVLSQAVEEGMLPFVGIDRRSFLRETVFRTGLPPFARMQEADFGLVWNGHEDLLPEAVKQLFEFVPCDGSMVKLVLIYSPSHSRLGALDGPSGQEQLVGVKIAHAAMRTARAAAQTLSPGKGMDVCWVSAVYKEVERDPEVVGLIPGWPWLIKLARSKGLRVAELNEGIPCDIWLSWILPRGGAKALSGQAWQIFTALKQATRRVFGLPDFRSDWGITEHYPHIFKLIKKSVHSDALADDLTQEVFLRVDKHIQAGKEVENLRAFLCRIASNRLADEFEANARLRKKLKTRVSEESLEAAHPAELAEQEKLERAEALQKAICRLPHKLRMVVRLMLRHHTQEEIARVLKVSVRTVKYRWKRARNLLRQHLKETL